MLKNFNLKKITEKFFRNKSKASETGEINTRRDWNILLVFFAVAVVISIAFGSYVYWKISKGSLFVASGVNESPIETINRSELKKTVDYYEEKSLSFEELKVKKPQYVDPSI